MKQKRTPLACWSARGSAGRSTPRHRPSTVHETLTVSLFTFLFGRSSRADITPLWWRSLIKPCPWICLSERFRWKKILIRLPLECAGPAEGVYHNVSSRKRWIIYIKLQMDNKNSVYIAFFISSLSTKLLRRGSSCSLPFELSIVDHVKQFFFVEQRVCVYWSSSHACIPQSAQKIYNTLRKKEKIWVPDLFAELQATTWRKSFVESDQAANKITGK
jgi:hypothetical protein